MQPESRIVKAVMDECRKQGWWCMKLHGGAFSLAGMPDVMAIKDGRVVFLEVKQPGKRPTPVQVRRMEELEGHGCPCAVVTSRLEAREFLRDR